MYFDIDSTYRNRTDFPNPADFAVLRPQNHTDIGEDVQDLCSHDTILFPTPTTPPLAFYKETISSPTTTIGQIAERTNLPYMYKTNKPTIIQLDELVIAPTDPTNLNAALLSALYPRGSVPPGQANNFYVDDVLENFNTNETRTIISYFYDTSISSNIFQDGVVLFYNSSGLLYQIGVDANQTATVLPPSNIDRFYQGKYLEITSGAANKQRRLIINYSAQSSLVNVFNLQSPLNPIPSPGDTFQIVSDRKWYATIDAPFTTEIPQYPVYRNPLPAYTFIYQSLVIDTTLQPLYNVSLATNPVMIVTGRSTGTNDTFSLPLNDLYLYNDIYASQLLLSNIPTQGNVAVTKAFTAYMPSAAETFVSSTLQDVVYGKPNQQTIQLNLQFLNNFLDSSLYHRDASLVTISGSPATSTGTFPANSNNYLTLSSFVDEILWMQNFFVSFDFSVLSGDVTTTYILWLNGGNVNNSFYCAVTPVGIYFRLGSFFAAEYVTIPSLPNPSQAWTSRTNSSNNNWQSVCWSSPLQLFCAVAVTGGTSAVMTSLDGITWTQQTCQPGSWNSVCWSDSLGLFCAVGSDVMTSPNGSLWTLQTPSDVRNWSSVCWSSALNLFCAVSTTDCAMYSSDGINWTSVIITSQNWESICWSDTLGIFCAVSSTGTNRSMISSDGSIWTYSSPFLQTWQSVCWSSEVGLFCAVSDDGNVMTSNNGISWTLQSCPSRQWREVIWASNIGVFCAVSSSGSGDRVMVSSNGVNWTLQTSAADNLWYGLCWSSDLGMLVAVSSSGINNRVMTSSYGYMQKWTSQSAPLTTWTSVCWAFGPELLCAVGTNSVMTSTNGILWSSHSIPTGSWRSICWSYELDLFCAVGSNCIATSSDGTLWTSQTPAALVNWSSVAWSSSLGIFCAVAPARIMTSANGITWTIVFASGSDTWSSICWSSDLNLFCTVSQSGQIMTSNNGTTWTVRTAPSHTWSSVCWGSSFCAVATDGNIATSTNGILWVSQSSPVLNNWRSVCWSSELGLFCAVASSGFYNRVITSRDGVLWTVQRSSSADDWNGICWSSKLGAFCSVSNATSNAAMTSTFTGNYPDITVECGIGVNGVQLTYNGSPVTPTFLFGSSTSIESITNLSTPTQWWIGGNGTTILYSFLLSNILVSSHINVNRLIGAYLFVPGALDQDSSGLNRTLTINPALTSSTFDVQGHQTVLTSATINKSVILNPAYYINLNEFVVAFWVKMTNAEYFTLSFTNGSTGLTITISPTQINVLFSTNSGTINYFYITSFIVDTYAHFIFSFLRTGVSLYINNVNVTGSLTFTVGNSSTYVSFNNVIPIINSARITPNQTSIDSLYFFEGPLSATDRANLSLPNTDRWAFTLYNSVSSYYNFAPVYTPFTSNIHSAQSVNFTFIVGLFTPDSNVPNLSQLYLGAFNVLAQPTSTAFTLSPPIYGSVLIHQVGVYNNYVYCYWSVFNRHTFSTYFSIASFLSGLDLFTSIIQVGPSISNLTPSNFTLLSYELGITFSGNTFYATVLSYDTFVFSYDLYISTNTGNLWTLKTTLPIQLSASLNVPNEFIGIRLIQSANVLFAFAWSPFSEFQYTYSTDGGTTFTSPGLIDTNVVNMDINTFKGEVSSKIFVAYNRNNGNGTYSTKVLFEQDFTISEGVQYRIRRNKPYLLGRANTNPLVSATLHSVVLPVGSAPSASDVLKGMFLWIYNDNVGNLPTATPFEMYNNTYLIKSYDAPTREVVVFQTLPDLTITALPPNTNHINWEVLGNVQNLFTGLDYFGPPMGIDRCYRVSLTHVILPNATLITGYGNQISFYPYIYIQLSSLDHPYQRFIYSNNPNAKYVTFKVPVSQFTNDPSSLPYIRLSSSTRAAGKFDLNKGFRFTIFLPNGELFQTAQEDTSPPDFPNPLLQVSAEFVFDPMN